MSATEVAELPVPIQVAVQEDTRVTRAPVKPKSERMNVTAIPFSMEETESIGEMLLPTEEPTNEWKDPNELIEAVFYNKFNNKIYKIYIDGSWESLGVERSLFQ
jgi:hypothetical protein